MKWKTPPPPGPTYFEEALHPTYLVGTSNTIWISRRWMEKKI
jgi:hypothetical protein